MKNMETQSQQQAEIQAQPSPKLTPPRLIWPAERKKRLVLRFSPTAWAKLLYFRDKSENEVGGFAVTEADDLLFVKDFITVKQEVTCVSVKFDDVAVADFFETQVDLARKPEEFARIWLHTHPGNSPEPSPTDETTFARVFGKCQWALMFVLAQNNKTYAKLSFNVGPTGQMLVPVEVDYSQDFGPSEHELWAAEYEANVKASTWLSDFGSSNEEPIPVVNNLSSFALPYDFINEFEKLDLVERQVVLDELANRPEFWDDQEEVMIL